MAVSKQTVVAFLTLSSDSSVVTFIRDIAYELPEYICKYVQLSNEDLDAFHMPGLEGYDAVVLLHSVQEGRNAITDVPDAQYDKLLPQLKLKYSECLIKYNLLHIKMYFDKILIVKATKIGLLENLAVPVMNLNVDIECMYTNKTIGLVVTQFVQRHNISYLLTLYSSDQMSRF